MVQDRADSKNFEDLDDLYGARTLVKKKVVKEQTDNEMLSEEVQKRKIQMKNASKNLMKVDEFLYNL